jgi:tryptophan synthase beta chain
VLHGNRTYLIDECGQVSDTHSVSAGLDYPGVGPEHAWLKDVGTRVKLRGGITDRRGARGLPSLTRVEGIMPALETAHALAYAKKLAPTMRRDQNIVWSTCPVAATRTFRPSPSSTASRSKGP